MAMREAVGVHKYLVRVYLEDNAVQVRDMEEIEKYTARNRELRAKQRMPHFEQELNGLVKGRRKQELQETLLQLGLVNLAMGSIDKGRVELEDELRVAKTQTRTVDPELEGNLKVVEDLQMIVDKVDAELHQIEAEVHHKRTELELERKKWDFNVKDITKEY